MALFTIIRFVRAQERQHATDDICNLRKIVRKCISLAKIVLQCDKTNFEFLQSWKKTFKINYFFDFQQMDKINTAVARRQIVTNPFIMLRS